MTDTFSSPTYPYERVQPGFSGFAGAQNIPKKILMYLLDLPDKAGYIPEDDNGRPRVRLLKYLWYDGANPLAEQLPTPEEKLSLVFDGDEPVLETEEQRARHPKGYRLYPQQFWGESQVLAQSTIKCYLGRVIPTTPFQAAIGITFQIFCNVNIEGTTRTDAYSRAYNMEQCILEALHGVNLTGIGVVDFSRGAHADNGSRPIADDGANVGRELKMSIAWADSGQNDEIWDI